MWFWENGDGTFFLTCNLPPNCSHRRDIECYKKGSVLSAIAILLAPGLRVTSFRFNQPINMRLTLHNSNTKDNSAHVWRLLCAWIGQQPIYHSVLFVHEMTNKLLKIFSDAFHPPPSRHPAEDFRNKPWIRLKRELGWRDDFTLRHTFDLCISTRRGIKCSVALTFKGKLYICMWKFVTCR